MSSMQPLATISAAGASCCAFLRKHQVPESSAIDLTATESENESELSAIDGGGGAPSATDVSSFLVIHTVLSAILVSSTWYLAYSLSSPARTSNRFGAYFAAFGKSLSNLIPASVQSWYQITASALSKKAESAARKSKSIQRLQQKYPKLDGVRVVASFVEAKIVRLFFKPITVPGRIWMSWRLTKWCKRCWDSRRDGDDECGNFDGVEELARRVVPASPVREAQKSTKMNMNA